MNQYKELTYMWADVYGVDIPTAEYDIEDFLMEAHWGDEQDNCFSDKQYIDHFRSCYDFIKREGLDDQIRTIIKQTGLSFEIVCEDFIDEFTK